MAADDAKESIAEKGKATRFQTGAKQVATARKGGIASGAAKRKRRATIEILSELVNLKPQMTARRRRALEAMGANPDAKDITVNDLIQATFIQKVLAGDLAAYKLYLELYGEDPRTLIEKARLELQKEAVEAMKSDGFMEAMQGVVEEVFEDGGDTPDALEDTD